MGLNCWSDCLRMKFKWRKVFKHATREMVKPRERSSKTFSVKQSGVIVKILHKLESSLRIRIQFRKTFASMINISRKVPCLKNCSLLYVVLSQRLLKASVIFRWLEILLQNFALACQINTSTVCVS